MTRSHRPILVFPGRRLFAAAGLAFLVGGDERVPSRLEAVEEPRELAVREKHQPLTDGLG